MKILKWIKNVLFLIAFCVLLVFVIVIQLFFHKKQKDNFSLPLVVFEDDLKNKVILLLVNRKLIENRKYFVMLNLDTDCLTIMEEKDGLFFYLEMEQLVKVCNTLGLPIKS